MLGIVKERMFGTFLHEDSKVSMENYYTIDLISRQHTNRVSRIKSQRSRDLTQYNFSTELANPKLKYCIREHHHTIDAEHQFDTI